MLKHYRPAGNKICLKKSTFKSDLISPLSMTLFQSGTASLAAALLATYNLKGFTHRKAEVLLPAYACPDLISSIIYAGAIPVLVDLQENSSFLSIGDLKKKITQNSMAIITINFLGIADHIDSLKKLCSQHSLYLINDSAQWFPKDLKSQNNWPGDFNIISFGRGKPVNLLHGGAVITTSGEKLKALNNIILTTKKSRIENSRIALKIMVYNLLINPWLYGLLTRLPGLNIGETKYTQLSAIKKMNSYYVSLLNKNIDNYISRKSNEILIQQMLGEIKNHILTDLFSTNDDIHNINLLRYPILIKDKTMRDQFYNETASLGVSLLYRRPLNEIKGLEKILDAQGYYPNASNFADHLVTIPTHAEINVSIINKIFDKLKMVLSEKV